MRAKAAEWASERRQKLLSTRCTANEHNTKRRGDEAVAVISQECVCVCV